MRVPSRRGTRQAQQGAALVEFALVLPVFSLMLFAMVQLGIVYAGWAQLRNSVQTAARLTSLGAAADLPQCGQLAQPGCSLAVQIGLPPGLEPNLTPVAAVPPAAACTATLASCSDYSWLDGYYIYNAGAWQQAVNDLENVNGRPSSSEVLDKQALSLGAKDGWACTATDHAGNCTELATGLRAATQGALGTSLVAVACRGTPGGSHTCSAGDIVVVCASLPATAFTGLLPAIHVSTQSAIYMETGTATTFDPENLTCA